MRQATLGVDIGGVIMNKANDETDTSFFSDNYLATTANEGTFDALAKLHRKFDGRVHIVSKCGRKIQQKSLDWFDHHGFYGATGIRPADVHFCRERHQKAPICERLGITHFVDDKLEVLSYLTTVPTLYLFMPSDHEVRKYAQHLHKVTRVESWQQLLRKENL